MTKQEAVLQALGQTLETVLDDAYGTKMGFLLLVTPVDVDDAICDFISNALREDSIEWMKATIERFENNSIIPATQGPTQ